MLYLVDASVYVFRAYYSLPPDMLDREGNPVHALFGFARFLGDLLERAKPRYLAVAFDESLATSFRNRIDPAYKANRDPAPPDLKLQFERCREFCRHVGVADFGSGEYEADDIIGTLHARFRAEGMPATVVSRDKDLAQLIREGDIYWNYTDNQRLTYGEIESHFGVVPERYADYLALTGDAVDNIPGVQGVGPKTATQLLQKYGSIEALLARLSEVKSESQRSNLMAAVDSLQRNRRLISLRTNLSGGPDLDALRIEPLDATRRERLGEMYRRWGFRSLLSELGLPWEASGQGTLL